MQLSSRKVSKVLKTCFLAGCLNFLVAYGGVFDAGRHVLNEIIGQAPQAAPSLSQEEALKLFDNFRSQKIYGDYSFVFELQHMPRQSKGSLFFGMIWGSWNEEGPIMRMELWPVTQPQNRTILIGQSGQHPKVWIVDTNAANGYRQLTPEEIFKPLDKNLVYSPFELFFNYFYWDNPQYLRPVVVKGRPAQAYRLQAPKWVKGIEKEYTHVDLFLDGEYGALIEAYILGENQKLEKSVKVLNFKKVQDQWIVKTIDLVDNVSKDKTRFDIRRAALNLQFDHSYFKPEKLLEPFPRIRENAYTVL